MPSARKASPSILVVPLIGGVTGDLFGSGQSSSRNDRSGNVCGRRCVKWVLALDLDDCAVEVVRTVVQRRNSPDLVVHRSIQALDDFNAMSDIVETKKKMSTQMQR